MNQTQKAIIKELKKLLETYPNQDMCFHIAVALYDYSNIEYVSDKVFLNSIRTYRVEKELNDSIPHEEDINKIIKDSENLNIDSLYDSYDEDEY